MSGLTQFGFDAIMVEPGAVLAVASDSGLVTFTESRRGTNAQALAVFNLVTRLVTAHPTYVNLLLDSKDLVYDEGGQAVVKLVWAGPDAGADAPVLPDPVWKLVRSPSQEPIDTHPVFESFAGILGSEINGAEFDPDTGLFIGFKTEATNVWGGVSKYLENGAVMTSTSVVVTEPSVNTVVPELDTPTPSGDNAINVPSIAGRTWMRTDFSIVRKGGVYEVFEEWTMSGQQGWNTVIYP